MKRKSLSLIRLYHLAYGYIETKKKGDREQVMEIVTEYLKYANLHKDDDFDTGIERKWSHNFLTM